MPTCEQSHRRPGLPLTAYPVTAAMEQITTEACHLSFPLFFISFARNSTPPQLESLTVSHHPLLTVTMAPLESEIEEHIEGPHL